MEEIKRLKERIIRTQERSCITEKEGMSLAGCIVDTNLPDNKRILIDRLKTENDKLKNIINKVSSEKHFDTDYDKLLNNVEEYEKLSYIERHNPERFMNIRDRLYDSVRTTIKNRILLNTLERNERTMW